MRESVVRKELQTAAEAFFNFSLERVVITAGVVAKVRQISRAADQRRSCWIKESRVTERGNPVGEESTAVSLRDCRNESSRRTSCWSRASNQVGAGARCGRIGVVGRPIGVEHVRALVSDVGQFKRNRRSHLPLEGRVPGIQSRQALNCRPY